MTSMATSSRTRVTSGPKRCIAAQLAVAEQRGATILRDEAVTAFDPADGGITVTTTGGDYTADRLVLTAGAWLPSLVGAEIARHFRIYRQRMIWLEIDGDTALFEPAPSLSSSGSSSNARRESTVSPRSTGRAVA